MRLAACGSIKSKLPWESDLGNHHTPTPEQALEQALRAGGGSTEAPGGIPRTPPWTSGKNRGCNVALQCHRGPWDPILNPKP